MARNKRHHSSKRKTSRKRRMSGIGAKGGIMAAVTTIAGAVAAQALGKVVIDPMTKSMDAKTQTLIDGAAPIAIGLLLPRFIKGETGKNIGNGMIAVGGLKLIQSTGILAGIGDLANQPSFNANISGYRTNVQGNYISGIKTEQGNYLAGLAALQEMED